MPKLLRYDPDNDFYKVLGVAPTATLDEIHRTYRQRAKLVHPDLNRDRREWAHDQFQRLNEAHDIIGDPERRVQYDQKRRLYQELHRPGVRSAALAEASRAAWARRHRRQPPALYYVSVGILMFGALPILYCILLSLISGVNRRNVQVVEVPSPTPFMVGAPGSVPTSIHPIFLEPSEKEILPQRCTNIHRMITAPSEGEEVHVPFVIKGSAYDEHFGSYYITYRYTTKLMPSVFPMTGMMPVKNGELISEAITTKWLTDKSGNFAIELHVLDGRGNPLSECGVSFHLNTPATEVANSANS